MATIGSVGHERGIDLGGRSTCLVVWRHDWDGEDALTTPTRRPDEAVTLTPTEIAAHLRDGWEVFLLDRGSRGQARDERTDRPLWTWWRLWLLAGAVAA